MSLPRRALRPSLVAALVACCLLGGGCIAKVAYQPNERLVQQLGLQRAEARFDEVVVRALDPPVDSVEVSDDGFTCVVQVGWPVPVFLKEKTYHFANIARVDLYENNKAFLIDYAGRELGIFLFGNPLDAQAFADLVMAFKAHGAHGEAAERD